MVQYPSALHTTKSPVDLADIQAGLMAAVAKGVKGAMAVDRARGTCEERQIEYEDSGMVENVTPAKVWAALQSDPQAQLVDVRTDAEWNYVGVPDLQEAAKQAVLIPWQIFPAMQVNLDFISQLREAGFTPEHKIYFLCRSGVRSLAAAEAAIAAGFPHAYNIADGFEGPPDSDGHRGTVAGWKASDLPWRQR